MEMEKNSNVNPEHKYKKSTIIKVGQDKPVAPKERHYVDKEVFYNALVERRKLVDAYKEKLANGEEVKKPKISDIIGENILKICTNLAKKYNFANKPYKDEMIGDAVEQCIKYIDSFDINKTNNPFSYFTQTAYYQYLDRIRLENKETYVKYKSLMDSLVLSELSEKDQSADNADHVHDNIELPDISHITDFISRFEESQRKNQKEPKPKKSKAVTLDEIWASDVTEDVVEIEVTDETDPQA